MQEAAKEDLNEDLEKLEQKILMIAFSDSEQYDIFASRVKKIQEELVGISDAELERNKAKIISQITTTIGDFDAYMDGKFYKPIDAFIPGRELESGYSKLRKYKVNLYSNILDDLKKLDYIDSSEIKKLKTKWQEDSKDLEFSPFELSAIDEKFADTFLEYQIKYIQAKGSFPKDVISEYTSLGEYQESLQQRLVQVSKTQDVSPQTQLEIEILMNEPNLERLLNSQNLWRILTSKNIVPAHKDVAKALNLTQTPEPEKIEVKKTELAAEPEVQQLDAGANLPMVVPVKKLSTTHMICTIEKTNRFFNKGQKSYKQVKVRVRNGIVELPKKYKDSIVEAFVPEGAEEIDREAFKDCKNLVNVSLPRTIKKIGISAFRNCPNLKNINLPSGLKTISSYAFYSCPKLQDMEFPEELETIGEYAFYYCKSLKKVQLKSKTHNLRKGAFSLCENLEEFEFSDSARTIPMQFFANCRNLKKIKFSKNLTKIEDYGLENCKELTDLSNLPDSLRYIGDYALWGCDNLERFYFPEALEGAGRKPLLHSKKLKEVIMARKIKNGNALFKLGVNPEAELRIPENPEGEFYKDFGIEQSTTVKMNDLIQKLVYVEDKRREDYLREYYGQEADKYI